MTDIISTTILLIFQSVWSYYSATKLAFLWELTKLLPKILQEFKNNAACLSLPLLICKNVVLPNFLLFLANILLQIYEIISNNASG
jgi:hypothetical protein